jgi:hypothetical protein
MKDVPMVDRKVALMAVEWVCPRVLMKVTLQVATTVVTMVEWMAVM